MTIGDSERIVVGVDGSPESDAAIRWAAVEAQMRHAPLTLLHVSLPGVSVFGLGYAMAPLPYDYGKLEEEEGQRILHAGKIIAERAVPPGAALQVHTSLVSATPEPTLIDATKDAQMIVVGSRGSGAWKRVVLGSVSNALCHHAHCPVAVIHDPAEDQRTGPVVVGIDGSPASELATAVAFDEASRRATSLVAVHAWLDHEARGIPVDAWPDFEPDAAETLAERLSGWSERHPDVKVERRVFFDQPARHLLDAAKSAQLTVVGSHGRGGFAGMLLGSVGLEVAHAIGSPVIVARRG